MSDSHVMGLCEETGKYHLQCSDVISSFVTGQGHHLSGSEMKDDWRMIKAALVWELNFVGGRSYYAVCPENNCQSSVFIFAFFFLSFQKSMSVSSLMHVHTIALILKDLLNAHVIGTIKRSMAIV